MKAVRFLVVDVSNSFTKWAVATEHKLGSIHRRDTPGLSTVWLRTLKRRHPDLPVVLSSVVPACTRRFATVFGRRLVAIHGEMDLGLQVDYPFKRQIGADRLANAVAARHFYGAPVVVVDFGTAVTFDIINAAGAYCGGVIAPGLNAMTDYLHARTALLPKIQLREPRQAVGRSTVEAMLSGTMFGYRGLVNGILDALKMELRVRGSLPVVATGGQAGLVAAGLPRIRMVNPLLTLEGLRIMGTRFFGRAKAPAVGL